MSGVLLVLLAPPGIGEALHDWLLDQGIAEFIEQEALEHGAEERFDNALDAVRGSRPRVMFQVATDEATARSLLAEAHQRWPRAGLRYWLLSMRESGTVG